jgi:hypothetical protein
MRQHIAIRREKYVAGTRERPEVGVFTQTHASRPPVPWGRIAVGEKVWMKWSAGLIVATARVQSFRQFEGCTPQRLRAATSGHRLYDVAAYWAALPASFYAVVIYLEDEAWLSKPLEAAERSYGASWIVLEQEADAERWLGRTRSLPISDTPSPPAGRDSRGRRRPAIPAALRFQVLRRDGFQCTYCGRRPPEVVLHVDHIRPWKAGGPTVLENLRTACVDCNLGKGATLLGNIC